MAVNFFITPRKMEKLMVFGEIGEFGIIRVF
jgi:hypothetical protein